MEDRYIIPEEFDAMFSKTQCGGCDSILCSDCVPEAETQEMIDVLRPRRSRTPDALYNRPAEPGSPEYEYMNRYRNPSEEGRDTMG